MDYEKDMRIDETALDIEWLEQSGLMMRYARNAASARMELDRAKEALELVKAELDKEIRMNPESFDIEKITDKVVENTIPMQKAYIEANDTFIKAKFDLDIAQAAVRAIEARKDALENLVRLYGQQYFAGPKMPRDITWEREEKEKRLNAAIAGKTRRRLL